MSICHLEDTWLGILAGDTVSVQMSSTKAEQTEAGAQETC